MHLVCTRCLSLMPEGTRWCQNQKSKCPPGTLSIVLDDDEAFDDMRILSLLRVYPTSALYKAANRRQTVFLKVAHGGFHDYLKAEAQLLHGIGEFPSLPRVLPTREHQPYGKWSLQGDLKYFVTYAYQPGVFLDTYLRDKPQLEPRAAALLLIQLADIAARIALKRRKLILNLRPESILVREDSEGILRPVVFDFGVLSEIGYRSPEWLSNSFVPMNLAPEILRGDPCLYQTDVYSLGGILYQVLAGEPAISSEQRTENEFRDLVLTHVPVSLAQRRREIDPAIAITTQRALAKNPAARQGNAHGFGKELREVVGEVPPERKGIQISIQVWIGVAAVALILILLAAFIILVESQ